MYNRIIKLPGSKILRPTVVFDTYWKFAKKRQDVFMHRVNGDLPPWTDDEIISNHRFTNAYRASDRVSQYLIKNVIYKGDQDPVEVFFRVLLFKIFNKIETWEALESEFGDLSISLLKTNKIDNYLSNLLNSGKKIYSAAYIMPSPNFGQKKKHLNHLILLRQLINEEVPNQLANKKSLRDVYKLLVKQPSLGPFLAFQFAIDLNYSTIINFSEMDFVVAGPGAINGLRKCFADVDGLNEADVIKVVADIAEDEFERLELDFKSLWGRRLQLIDCQNLFCETDKYARIAHPEFKGKVDRKKIKQKFKVNSKPLPQFYPPKWNISRV